jgi:hypothetical protein
MSLRTFLTIAAVVALVYGVGLILVPGTMDSMYGLSVGASERLISQLFGVTLLALGLIDWLARDLIGESVRPIIIGSLIGNVLGLVVSVAGTLGGTMNALGWSAVVIYLLLTLGFGYFQFMRPAAR